MRLARIEEIGLACGALDISGRLMAATGSI